MLCAVEEFLRAFVDVMQDKTVRDAEKYFDMTQARKRENRNVGKTPEVV